MPQFVRRLNRWLLFLILLALCAFPIQFLLASKFKEGGLSFSFGMPTDDIVLMLHSNTAYVGRYLVPIDEQNDKASPYQQSGETLVPARFLASKLEAELAYDQAKGTITFTKDDARVTYRLNKPEVKIAGATSPVKTTPHVKDGLTYVPLRPVSEALGRNIYARDGVIALRNRDDAPNETQWNDWRKELSQYIDYDTFGPYGVQLGGRFERVFRRWEDAVAYARQAPGRRVTYRGSMSCGPGEAGAEIVPLQRGAAHFAASGAAARLRSDCPGYAVEDGGCRCRQDGARPGNPSGPDAV